MTTFAFSSLLILLLWYTPQGVMELFVVVILALELINELLMAVLMFFIVLLVISEAGRLSRVV